MPPLAGAMRSAALRFLAQSRVSCSWPGHAVRSGGRELVLSIVQDVYPPGVRQGLFFRSVFQFCMGITGFLLSIHQGTLVLPPVMLLSPCLSKHGSVERGFNPCANLTLTLTFCFSEPETWRRLMIVGTRPRKPSKQ